MSERIALIFGIGGQDGVLLAQELLAAGYEVHGTSRQPSINWQPFHYLGLAEERVTVHRCCFRDVQEVVELFASVQPTHVFHLAAQSSVSISFNQPYESSVSILGVTAMILEAVKKALPDSRLFHAASSECFGLAGQNPGSSDFCFDPVSPYGIAKTAACALITHYRKTSELFCVNGYLYNHESEFRADDFVVPKIFKAALDIKEGRSDVLELGNVDIRRDFGLASEYVTCMRLMLEQSEPQDVSIATGTGITIRDVVNTIFDHYGLDPGLHLTSNDKFIRVHEAKKVIGDPVTAERVLGWQAEHRGTRVFQELAQRRDRYMSWCS